MTKIEPLPGKPRPLTRAVTSVLDSLPVGLLIASAADGGVQYANWAAAALFEQEPEALLGGEWPHARFVRRADGSACPREHLPLWRSLNGGESLANVALVLELPSGTRRDVLVSSVPLRDDHGRTTGALVVYRDASQLKTLQEALSRLNGDLVRQNGIVRAIVEQSSMPVAVTSYPERRLILTNGAYQRVVAHESGQELLGRRIEEVLPDAAASGLLERLERAVSERQAQIVPELRRVTPAGESYWNLSYTPLSNPAGQIDRVLELWQNVTTQVMAQRHLEEVIAERTRQLDAQQRQLESLVIAGMSLSAEHSQEGVLQRLSEVARELLHARQATLQVWNADGATTQFTAEEAGDEAASLSVRSITEALREILGPEGAAAYSDRIGEDTVAGRSLLQVPVICRGQVFGQLQVTEKRDEGPFSDTDEVLAVGLAAQAAVAMENARLFRDLEAQQARLMRAERLSAIGTLAGGIAHDLRQPLNVLKLTVQLLRQSRTPRSEAERRQLERMEQHVDQASRIVQDLLSLARDELPQVSPTDLNELVSQFAESYGFPAAIQVRIEKDADLAAVPVDPGQMRQVLSHLARNAVEAMAERGGALLFRVQGADGWAAIEVQDEGTGISRDHLPRVFEPLFTTRRMGAGLGLTLCQRVVAAHGGQIEVESEEGSGTRVVVRVPAG